MNPHWEPPKKPFAMYRKHMDFYGSLDVAKNMGIVHTTKQQKKTPCEIKSWWPNECSNMKGYTPQNSVVVFFKRWCELPATTITPLGELSTLQRLKHWFCIQEVGGWTNPFETYEWKWEFFPKDRGENTKIFGNHHLAQGNDVFFPDFEMFKSALKRIGHSRCRNPSKIVWKCLVLSDERSIHEASKTLV